MEEHYGGLEWYSLGAKDHAGQAYQSVLGLGSACAIADVTGHGHGIPRVSLSVAGIQDAKLQ